MRVFLHVEDALLYSSSSFRRDSIIYEETVFLLKNSNWASYWDGQNIHEEYGLVFKRRIHVILLSLGVNSQRFESYLFKWTGGGAFCFASSFCLIFASTTINSTLY